jgi:hypothetical protein
VQHHLRKSWPQRLQAWVLSRWLQVLLPAWPRQMLL